MMTAAVFLATLGSVGAAVALATSLLTQALPWSDDRAPARRADAAWMLGAAPALTSGLVMLATAVPSIRLWLGGIHLWLGGARPWLGATADHCAGHTHHLHLCWAHGSSTPTALAAVGGLWWGWTALRVARVAVDAARASRLARALASRGTDHEGVIRVPTTIALCHAVGPLRPRVLISDRVWEALPDDERAAVIAHERGHLRRSDPAAATGLALVSAFASPPAARLWRDRWRAAAEQAADAEAAGDTDAATLAAALVRVARLHLADGPGLAATPHALEVRVARLLTGPDPAVAGRLVARLGVFAAVAIAIAIGGADPVHHLVEDVVAAVTHAVAGAHDG